MLADALKSMKGLIDSGDLSLKIDRTGKEPKVHVFLSLGLFEIFYLSDYEVGQKRSAVMKILGITHYDLARERFTLLLRGIRTYINFLFKFQGGTVCEFQEFDFFVIGQYGGVTHKGHFGGQKELLVTK